MQRVLFHKVLKDIPKQDGSYSLLVWQGAGVANNMATWMVRGVKNRGWGRKYSEAFLFKILIPASVSGEENLTPLCFSGGKKIQKTTSAAAACYILSSPVLQSCFTSAEAFLYSSVCTFWIP